MPEPILSGIGVPGPLNFSGFSQAISIAQQNKMLRQREAFQAQQREENRRQQTGEFMERMLNDKNYLSGTDEDPEIQRQLGQIQTKAYSMAQSGSHVPDIMNGISGDLSNLNQYRAKSKFIGNEIDQSVARMKNNKGIDSERLAMEAKKQAFYDIDPKTGAGTLKDVSKIDPTTDWTKEALDAHPDIANFKGLDDYIKGLPQQQGSENITTQLTPKGKPQVNQFDVKRPYYMDWDKNDDGTPKTDNQGVPTGMVPKFQNIHGDADPVTGQAPVIGRGVTDEVYNQILGDNPEVAYALRAQQQKDMPGVDYRDPKAQLYMKQHLYDELQSRNNTYYKKVEKTGTSPEQQQETDQEQINLSANKSSASTTARLNAERRDRQLHPEDYEPTGGDAPKERPIDSILKIVSGTTPVDGKGQVGILPYIAKGEIKVGPKASDVVDDAKFDTNTGDLIVKKGGKQQVIPQAQMGQFLRQIGVYNGMSPSELRGLLDKYGYKNGAFGGFQPKPPPTWQQRGSQVLNDRMGGGSLGVPSPQQLGAK
jgi:hypothetical protein